MLDGVLTLDERTADEQGQKITGRESGMTGLKLESPMSQNSGKGVQRLMF